MLFLALHLRMQHFAPEHSYFYFLLHSDLWTLLNLQADQFPSGPWAASLTFADWLHLPLPLAAAFLNSILCVSTVFLSVKLYELLTQKRISRYVPFVAVPLSGVLLIPSIQLTELPLALFMALLGLYFYFRQNQTASFFLTLACAARPELLGFWLLANLENFFLRRVSLRSQLVGSSLGIVAGFYLFKAYFSHIAIRDFLGGIRNWSAPSAATIIELSDGVFSALRPHTTPAFLALGVCIAVISLLIFGLKHLHAPQFVIRDRRNYLLFSAGFIAWILTFCFGGLQTPGIFMLSLLPMTLATLISISTRPDISLRIVGGCLVIPLSLNFVFSVLLVLTQQRAVSFLRTGQVTREIILTSHQLRQTCPACTVMSTYPLSTKFAFRGRVLGVPSQERELQKLIESEKPRYILGDSEALTKLRQQKAVSKYSPETVEGMAQGSAFLLARKP